MKKYFVQLLMVIFFTVGSLGLGFAEVMDEDGGEMVIVTGKTGNETVLLFTVPDKYLTSGQALNVPASLIVRDLNKEIVLSMETMYSMVELSELKKGKYSIEIQVGGFVSAGFIELK